MTAQRKKAGPGKRAGKAVSIVGVTEPKSRRIYETMKRRLGVLSAYVIKGSLHAIGLAYPHPGVLPDGEAAVTALTISAEGALCGATSGEERAHLFHMPRPGLIGDMGVIPGVCQVAESVVLDANGMVHGASRDKGGPLFSCDLTGCYLGPYNASNSPILTRRGPFRDDGVISLAISNDKTVIAGVAEHTGRLFLYSLKRRTIRRLPPIVREGDAFGRVLAAARDGAFYGSGKEGQLFRMSVEGDVEWLGAHVPCRRGKGYLARVSSLVQSRNGLLYGGTEDGYLFSLDLGSQELISHGRASDIPDLHALAEGGDGAIYGLTGRYPWASHLVAFRPDRSEWEDLGFFKAHGHYPWIGYQMRALVAGPGGELYAGEHDRFGHLFMYYPPYKTGT